MVSPRLDAASVVLPGGKMWVLGGKEAQRGKGTGIINTNFSLTCFEIYIYYNNADSLF